MCSNKNIEKLLKQLDYGNSNRKSFASASADLAEIIWSGAIAEEQLIDWLTSGTDGLRSSVAWAVWDSGGPRRALEHLMTSGNTDSDYGVRLYSLKALVDYLPNSTERTTRISAFQQDSHADLRQRAQQALKTCTGI